MFSQLWNYNIKKIGFEDIKQLLDVKNKSNFIIINTLMPSEQNCLIQNTMDISLEEDTINKLLDEQQMKIKIIIYGKHCCDEKTEKKAKQLMNLGFREVYVYYGGLFEWLLLQDIYGYSEFPTTTKILDLLKYRPDKILHLNSI